MKMLMKTFGISASLAMALAVAASTPMVAFAQGERAPLDIPGPPAVPGPFDLTPPIEVPVPPLGVPAH